MTDDEKVSPNKMDKDYRKRYARAQLKFLKENGIENARQRSRIFKAAGPGQVQSAWELATCENWEVEKTRKDVLECLLAGAGCVRWGRKRMEEVLLDCGFPVPKAYSVRQFFRILDGALEILSPGSYEFTEKELAEIETGLDRHFEKTRKAAEKDGVEDGS